MSGCPTCPWHTEDKSPLDARGTPPHVAWTVNHPPRPPRPQAAHAHVTGSEHSDWLVGMSTSRSEALGMGIRASGGATTWGSGGAVLV